MPRFLAGLTLAVVAAFLALPAAAKTASFSISPSAVFASGGAGAGLGVEFTGSGAFGFGFTLPKDYRDDSAIVVQLVVYDQQAVGPCSFNMSPARLFQFRNGKRADRSLSGFAAKNGGIFDVKLDEGVAIAKLTIKPGGDLAGLKSGDALALSVERDHTLVEDTCQTIAVFGINIKYKLK